MSSADPSPELANPPAPTPAPTPEGTDAARPPKPTLRKAGLFLVALLATFFVFDRGIAYLFNRLVMHSQFRLSRIYKGDIKADVLIVGNSRGVNGFFAPEIQMHLQRPVYNLCFNGMDFKAAQVLVADYLDHNPRPKILVLEVTSIMSSDMIKGVKFLSVHSTRTSALLRNEHYNLWLAGEISHVYRYNTEVFMRELYYLNTSDQSWVNTRQIDEPTASGYIMPRAERAKWEALGPSQVEALQGLVRLARNKQIELRVVVTPYLPNYLRQVDIYPQWLASVQKAVGPQTPVWDYSDALTDDAHFADTLHANKEGSLVLLQQMEADHFFETGALPPDHSLPTQPTP